MLRTFLRHLLPGTCVLCGASIRPTTTPDLCPFCVAVLPWNEPACPRCAQPLTAGGDLPCRRCRRQPPPFEHVVAPLRYEGCAQTWIGRLKDHLGMVEGRILGTLLADAAEACYRGGGIRPPDLFVPVPLTARRLARRGHNQALTLARPVARRLGVPILRRALVRHRDGRRQRGLPRTERLRNLAGVFDSRRRWPEPGPCIGIVDDVMTTGATAAELSRVLLASGAARVHVLCAARTPLTGA